MTSRLHRYHRTKEGNQRCVHFAKIQNLLYLTKIRFPLNSVSCCRLLHEPDIRLSNEANLQFIKHVNQGITTVILPAKFLEVVLNQNIEPFCRLVARCQGKLGLSLCRPFKCVLFDFLSRQPLLPSSGKFLIRDIFAFITKIKK